MNTLLTRISGVFEISSPLIPKEDLIHMYFNSLPFTKAPLTHRIRFRMKAEISSPVWPTGVHTYPVKTAFNENASFQKFSTEWRFLKMPICCIRVRGWNRRFLITITSRCWIPLCAYSHQCAFVWKGKDDSKTQLKRHEFFWKRRKKKQIRFQIKRDTCGRGQTSQQNGRVR